MNLKRAIGQIQDVQELRELRKAIVDRIDAIQQREYAKRCAAAWERVKDLPIGTKLYVCASGTFFGGPFQRGDSFPISYIQPRKQRLWVAHNGKQHSHWFGAQGVERYDLRTTPPEKPMGAEERKHVEAVAGRVAEAIA